MSDFVGVGLEHAFQGVQFEPGVVAVMRDGCRLVADVYRPTTPGPHPVLLVRQPYGRDIATTVTYAHPTYFARRGYLVVIQDVRGRGDSEGVFDPFVQEFDDGEDSVAWAAALPGSNGRVGMYGFSYQGYTQLAAAVRRPPALHAIAPAMTAGNLFDGWFTRQGVLQLSTTLGWGNQMLREDARRRQLPAAAALEASWRAPGSLSHHLPVAQNPVLTDPALPTYAGDWLRHPTDDDYWRARDLLAAVAELDLPMFHVAGWHDFYLRGSMNLFAACQRARQARRGGRPLDDLDHFLLVGPWTHLPWGNRVGPVDYGPAARPDTDALLADWFDAWLPTERRKERPGGVQFFVQGENRWHTTLTWPPPRGRRDEYFLCSQGRANSRFGDGILRRAPQKSPEDLFHYDPEVPVPAPGGNLGGSTAFGPFDQAPMQQGNNLLVYTAPPVKDALTITGRPVCRLYVRSSAPDTCFVARLSRVKADGTAPFICLGAALLSTGERQADGTTLLTIELDDTAQRLEPGESLRLDLASSAWPLLIRHPNTTQPATEVASVADFRRALQVVYHDPDHPSVLELPVLA